MVERANGQTKWADFMILIRGVICAKMIHLEELHFETDLWQRIASMTFWNENQRKSPGGVQTVGSDIKSLCKTKSEIIHCRMGVWTTAKERVTD
jgi:hypothetical protein